MPRTFSQFYEDAILSERPVVTGSEPVIAWLAETGGIAAGELGRTFNCGIGMAAIVAPDDVQAAIDLFNGNGETAYRIGAVVGAEAGRPAVTIRNVETAWPG